MRFPKKELRLTINQKKKSGETMSATKLKSK